MKMSYAQKWGMALVAVAIVAAVGYKVLSSAGASPTAAISLPFSYVCSSPGTLKEIGSSDLSTSPYFWLNSGAYMYIKDGTCQSIQGDLPKTDPRYVSYKDQSPIDTDGGLHPQALFRLFTRTKWANIQQTAQFKINKYNLSASSNRYESNALLLFSHVVDNYNLYYAGMRVDGTAVIKKKKASSYYTIAQKKILPGTYNRTTNPILLPVGKWVGLRTITKNLDATRVQITVQWDPENDGTFVTVLTGIDDGVKYGGSAFRSPGIAGIRTDFMDFEFDNYNLSVAP